MENSEITAAHISDVWELMRKVLPDEARKGIPSLLYAMDHAKAPNDEVLKVLIKRLHKHFVGAKV